MMYQLCFILVLLMPAAMFGVGLRWRVKTPPFKTGHLVYRTELTEKSPEVWRFAHVYCGKLWTRFGAVLVVISIALMLVFRGSYQKFLLWLLGGQMLLMCVTVFMIDLFAHNLFDENGVHIDPNASF